MGQEEEKLNLGEYVVDDRRKQYQFAAAPGVEDCKFTNTDDSIAYAKYAQEHNDSEGFDIEHFVGEPVDGMPTLKPVPFERGTPLFEDCEKAVKHVLKYLDAIGEQSLEYFGFWKANYRSSYLFFVTFEAENKNSTYGPLHIYQSVIFSSSKLRRTSLYLFRHAPVLEKLKLGDYIVDDRRRQYEFLAAPGVDKCKFTCADDFFAYKKYAKDHNESRGYDIRRFVSKPPNGFLTLMPVRIPDDPFEDCKKAIQHVLKYLDATYELRLELVRVISANYRSTHLFFVTFEAKGKHSGRKQDYQAVIYSSSKHGRTSLFEFRERRVSEKLKLGDYVVDDRRRQYEFHAAPGVKKFNFTNADDLIAYKKYAKEHDESEGYDIEHFVSEPPDHSLMLKPVHMHDELLEDCKRAVEHVLKYLDATREVGLELVRIISANYRSEYLFFVTWEAKVKPWGKIKEYQAVIYSSSGRGRTSLYEFREKTEEKLNLDLDVPAFSDDRGNYKVIPAGGLEESEFDCKDDFIAYKKYAAEHDRSDGFDIKHFLSPRLGFFMLRPVRKSNSFIFEKCLKAVRTVLKYLDARNERKLELVRVIKSNYRPAFVFFVTFEAKCKESGVIKVYQSIILHSCVDGETSLSMFRKKGEAATARHIRN